MRFSLISLTVLGIGAVGLYGLSRQPTVDLGLLTSSVNSLPSPPKGPRPPAPPAEKTERVVAQLLYPNQNTATPARPGSSSLVIAQAPAAAQPAPPVPSANPQQVISAAAVPPGQQPPVDESALRYFAARGDTARLQAEISRLRALYPNWTPPADPLAVQINTDRQLENMWALYAQSRYADVRKAVADRQATEPGWQPPADLLDRLKLAEARAGLVTASDAENHDAVIRMAADNPSLLTCSEVDILWRVAEAFALTDRQGRARDAYTYILDNCDDSSERFATAQKASGLLPPDMLEDLLAKERTPAGSQPEFEPLRDDIARRLAAAGNTDAKLVVPEKYLIRLERLAEAEGKASDALMLGWYFYRRDNLGGAERWFRRAFNKEETASAAEGLALTLVAQKSPVEAETVLYRWRETSDGAKQAYLAAVANLLALDPPPVLQDDVLRRMAPMVITARNADAAQQFGWYARAMQQPQTAAEWFQAALAWKPDDEPSAYGLALTRNDLGDKAGVAQIQRAWNDRSERITRLGEPVIEREVPRRQPAVASRPNADGSRANAPAAGPPAEEARPVARTDVTRAAPQPIHRTVRIPGQAAVRRGQCSTTLDPRRIPPEAALARGWCLMDLNRPLEAAQSFDAAYASSSAAARSDAAYGKSLAYLRAGLTDKASVAAADSAQTNQRAVELQTAILSDRAVNAFKAGRYRETLLALDQRAQIAPEQSDLMSLRGYAHLNLGRLADATRIFQALADMGDKAGLRGLADVQAMN
ncbi:cellulose synthase [Neorhizobium galegae]|uniref:cellulose synthase n=1 Tax=Neorhizobium galegae TaxID=399 RepID=UPI002101A015|nr:cellulose synthase [Neorhizobium galegae]MCQ1573432.1 cellulose synthase [Neorhizobium galegae]